ncbi:peripheral-type benzodiazepine receptor-associated protein 1 isoform X4 [Entelurus aequoreus]|uniref:peripheral-type benzodiazepine receptor-associated protein 1 isoform X4 n=1 Tax=Entelurus aequoreus TaxID=161455 RepID=UPI002B1CF75C|nr:peripheral-type benzodiazepine receptor-associated protein 1 isoform X4 [Entelurus aequoreus]
MEKSRGKKQQELKKSEHRDDKQRLSDKAMVARADITLTTTLRKRHHSLYANLNRLETEKQHKNGTDHRSLVQQNFELLRALGELEKTCSILREENSLLRKSSAPQTEEKVKRLRKKNTELAVLAKRLEERARKLQEANLKMGSPVPLNGRELEKLLKQSQMEVLRLQRQLSITSSTQRTIHNPDSGGAENCEIPTEEECAEKKESELTKKRKECESLEHEVKKRQKKCLDLESRLEDEQAKNAQLKEEADLFRRKTQLLKQIRVENDELREELSKVTAQHNYVLEENQRLRAKLENLEQVLKRMRDVAERRQQLELEHEQALAILKFKQDEIKRLQRAQLFARREHEGVVQMLESKVRDLEEKCRSQSEQFGLLSQELENFRLQASKADLAGSGLLSNSSFSVLTNGVGLSCEQDYTDSSWDMESLSEIAFWSLEGGGNLSCPEDVAAALRMGTTSHTGGLPRVECSPVTKHRELPTISVSKSASSSSKSETTNVTSKSNTNLTPHKSSQAHEVDTASEVEELDIDMALAPYTASRGTAKLQVFIARYSYNPYDGPNDNPEMELPLTAGEYIYVYGGMDDDGFYEGELMDGRRGLVPSNFVERLSDDDVMGSHPEETSDMSHNTLLNSSLHSASNQHHLHTGVHASERTEASSASGPASASSNSALAVSAPLTNGLDLDLEEMEVDTVPYPRKLKLIKQLAKSIIISWDPPLVPAGWGNVWSYNVYVDQELRLNVPFGAQTKAVLERLDINLKAYRVSVQSLTEKGLSDQLRCSMLIGRDICVAPTQLRVYSITATSASLSWLPCNSNYVHIVSLNEQECELVKAGCYSLCLNNLLPSLQYTVKVEARPHRTAWELPVERREHRSATINFSTLTAGPPDAPLDVQLEHGPSPGIALISWLPVTIDNAGTSNGVHVTGYTIYADKKKVLEVSSPTAGSALLGPSQIQSLQTAQDLTVRTMSAHGESCDSFPVNVPSKLAAIMAGPAAATLVVPTLACTPVRPTNLSRQLTFENSSAKVSMLPDTIPPERPITGLTVDDVANCLHIPPSEAFVSSASFAKTWTSPLSAVSMAACEATLPVTSPVTPEMNMTPPTSSALQPSPVIKPVPAATTVTQVVTLEQRRNTDSPGTMRPFPSITEFIEEPSAIHGTPERIPTPPKTPITDLLNPQDTLILRPPSTSSLDSEVDEELENKRLVSIEEFLRQDHDPMYNKMQEGCSRGLVEHLTDNIRSDLFDILEEEEEDLNSDHFREASTREYTIIANMLRKSEPSDSDEDILERILKLPPQVYHNKQLFSIPEVTEDEDSVREEPLPHRVQVQLRPSHLHPRDTEQLHHVSQRHPPYSNPNFPPPHHHFNSDPRSLTKEPLLRRGPLQVKPKLQYRVHYSDAENPVNYPSEKLVCLCEGPTNRPPQSTPNKHRIPLRGLEDRLRREAMLRSQMAAGYEPTTPRPYPISKLVRPVRSPISGGMAIDVEYGTDDVNKPGACTSGEVVMEQLSSEWWIEGAEMEHIGPSYHQGKKADSLEPHQLSRCEAVPSWVHDSEHTSKPVVLEGKQLKGCFESPKTKGDTRIFVALFPYDPATMSPNPDASEEELLFREGQIITVYGDKDSDGFYQGESGGRLGYVPCNMVSEIQVEDEETRQQILQQGFLSTEASMEKIDPSQVAATCAKGKPVPGSRKMVAIFDYDPRESSPNTDIEVELTFSAGDVINVIGDMDEDGFFYGDLHGQRGLVPSNFLQAFPENAPAEDFSAQPVQEHKKESQGTSSTEPQEPDLYSIQDTFNLQPEPALPNRLAHVDPLPHLQLPGRTTSDLVPVQASPPTPQLQTDSSTQDKKKKRGIFSKGKKLFKRFGFSKKE